MVRDLGSRNGTWIDMTPLEAGLSRSLQTGSSLSFGRNEPEWHISDAGPPGARAVSNHGAEVEATFDLLALPNDEEPRVTIYRLPSGTWVLEGDGDIRRVVDGDTITLEDAAWELKLTADAGTSETLPSGARARSLSESALHYRVSLDEEHVDAEVRFRDAVSPLHARAHHITLLYLARARIEDAKNPEIPTSSHGWVYGDIAARELDIAEAKLNLHVFKARRQLAEAGIEDAAGLVERRAGSGQLRIGVAALSVEQV